MSIQDLGALGEFISSIAVVLTLIYLAVQIRQNTKTTRTTASNSALSDLTQLTNHNERYISMLLKAHHKEKLTPDERIHMVERFVTIMRTLENLWYQHKLGNLSKDQFYGRLDVLRWTLSIPVTHQMWAEVEQTFDPEFREIVLEHALSRSTPEGGMIGASSVLHKYRIEGDIQDDV